MHKPHLSERQVKRLDITSKTLLLGALVGALAYSIVSSDESDSTSIQDIPPAVASAPAVPGNTKEPILTTNESKDAEPVTFEQIPVAKVRSIQIEALGIDQQVPTVILDIKEGVAQYLPRTLDGIESAKVDYHYSRNEKPDYMVGTVGINNEGNIPPKRKLVLYGHTVSGAKEGVFDNITSIQVKSSDVNGDKLIATTDYGMFTYEAVARIVQKTAVELATPEVDENIPKFDLLVVACLLTDDGQQQTGKRIIYAFNLIDVNPK